MSHDLQTVAEFQFLAEAQAARLHLQAEEIPAFIADAETVTADWFLGNAIGYIKLQVPGDRAEAARAALQRRRRTPRDGEEDARSTPKDSPCLACGAVIPNSRRACPQCGWSYESDDSDAAPPPGRPVEPQAEIFPSSSGMARLRSWKKPVLLVMLAPVVLSALVLLLEILRGISRMLVP